MDEAVAVMCVSFDSWWSLDGTHVAGVQAAAAGASPRVVCDTLDVRRADHLVAARAGHGRLRGEQQPRDRGRVDGVIADDRRLGDDGAAVLVLPRGPARSARGPVSAYP
jgi:hypothetical protein